MTAQDDDSVSPGAAEVWLSASSYFRLLDWIASDAGRDWLARASISKAKTEIEVPDRKIPLQSANLLPDQSCGLLLTMGHSNRVVTWSAAARRAYLGAYRAQSPQKADKLTSGLKDLHQ